MTPPGFPNVIGLNGQVLIIKELFYKMCVRQIMNVDVAEPCVATTPKYMDKKKIT